MGEEKVFDDLERNENQSFSFIGIGALGEALIKGFKEDRDMHTLFLENDENLEERVKGVIGSSEIVFVGAELGEAESDFLPMVLDILDKEEVLPLALLTLPLKYEGKERIEKAEHILDFIKKKRFAYSLLDMDKTFHSAKDMSLEEMKEEVVYRLERIPATYRSLLLPYLISLTMDDLKTITSYGGMLFAGEGEDDDIEEATKRAVIPYVPFQEKISPSDILLNIVSDNNLNLQEVDKVIDVVRESFSKDVNIIFGCGINTDLKKRKVTIIGITSDDRIDLEETKELRHRLHQYPNLSGKEGPTMDLLEEYLKKNPLCEIKRYPEFLLVHMKGYGKPIALRSDMDALPISDEIEKPWKSLNEGVGHKCGHDGHMAALCGLARSIHDENHRDLYLVFQPSEENGEGAMKVLPELLRLGIIEIYAFHNWSGHKAGLIWLKPGVSQCASLGLTLKFTGVTSHASMPERGINPASAISSLISYDYKELPHNGLFLSTIINVEVGKKDFGISPANGEISLTLRAEHSSDLETLKNAYIEKARALATKDGMKFDYEIQDEFPDTENDSGIIENLNHLFERRCIPYAMTEKTYRASEDFGLYLKDISGAMMYIGNGEDYPGLHTKNYDFNDDLLEPMIRAYLCIIHEE